MDLQSVHRGKPRKTSHASSKSPNILRSRPLQLRILLHQLFQPEARELYRNLSFFAFPFALIDCPFTVFRMLHPLPRPESAPSFRLFDRQPGHAEFLPARSKEFCDVVDRVVGLARIRCSLATPVIAPRPAHTLIFIFISIVP